MEKLKGKSKYIFIGIIIILVAIITVLIINKKSDRFETISTTKENVGTISKNENKSNREDKEITTDDKVTIR
jgi:cell division protein FtsL